MNPEKVLDRLASKKSISLIEAERGILACILDAVEEQRTKDPGPINSAFGGSIAFEEEESALREQFRDVVARYRDELGGLNRKVLRKSAEDIESRLGMGSWDGKVVEEYRKRFSSLVEKSS